jgi:hypothetical protein
VGLGLERRCCPLEQDACFRGSAAMIRVVDGFKKPRALILCYEWREKGTELDNCSSIG